VHRGHLHDFIDDTCLVLAFLLESVADGAPLDLFRLKIQIGPVPARRLVLRRFCNWNFSVSAQSSSEVLLVSLLLRQAAPLQCRLQPLCVHLDWRLASDIPRLLQVEILGGDRWRRFHWQSCLHFLGLKNILLFEVVVEPLRVLFQLNLHRGWQKALEHRQGRPGVSPPRAWYFRIIGDGSLVFVGGHCLLLRWANTSCREKRWLCLSGRDLRRVEHLFQASWGVAK